MKDNHSFTTATTNYIAFEQLVDSILTLYRRSIAINSRIIVLIGGCARVGKTSLARKLQDALRREHIETLIVPLDNWLLGLGERQPGSTVRERYEYDKIATAFKRLLAGEQVYHPVYDAKTRKRIQACSPTPIYIKNGIIVADGVVALDIPELRAIASLKIFVDLEDQERLRRLKTFYHEYKRCSLETTNKIIAEREREEVPLIKATKRYADIIYYGWDKK
jgi:uridine kinase